MTEQTHAVMRIGSHVAYDRIENFLRQHGEPFACYWKDLHTSGYFTVCPLALVAEARKLKGITKTRHKPQDMRKCWKPSEPEKE